MPQADSGFYRERMSALKPSVVIFSSSTIGVDIAKKLAGGLGAVAECQIWDTTMHPGRNISEELQKLLDAHDFAICVLTGDRDSGQPGKYLPSENVVFEAGLCYGSLGPKRTFLFCHEEQHRNLPADVGGDIYVSYKEGEDLVKACGGIAKAIINQGRRIRPPRVFRQFNEAFGSIGKQLSQGLDADSAELVQHSSVRASILVSKLINRQVDVDMYLQHPDVAQHFSMHRKAYYRPNRPLFERLFGRRQVSRPLPHLLLQNPSVL